MAGLGLVGSQSTCSGEDVHCDWRTAGKSCTRSLGLTGGLLVPFVSCRQTVPRVSLHVPPLHLENEFVDHVGTQAQVAYRSRLGRIPTVRRESIGWRPTEELTKGMLSPPSDSSTLSHPKTSSQIGAHDLGAQRHPGGDWESSGRSQAGLARSAAGMEVDGDE